MKDKESSLKFFFQISLLLLAIVLCWYLFLWLVTSGAKKTDVRSETGVWDLRTLLTEYDICYIKGQVEYIPEALLTPIEFAAREGEAVTGYPQEHCQYATSRMRVLVPDNGYYFLYCRSIDFAHRLYANGELIYEMGKPGDSRETSKPDTGYAYLTIKAEDGVIELIQQASNFVHRDGGGHGGFDVSAKSLRTSLAKGFSESIKLGAFISLFIVHMVLFVLLGKRKGNKLNKGNLYFALFCLMWFLRAGVTGTRIFTSLFPQLSWELKFRIEYLSIPITAVLLLSILEILFPFILHRQFRYVLYGASAAITVIFLFSDTLFMSYALLWCEVVYVPAIIYIVIRFAMKLWYPKKEQSLFLAGALVFFLAAVNDILDSNNFFALKNDLTSFSMLLFTFCQAVAVFIVTVREMKMAEAENEVLKEKNMMIERQLSKQRLHYMEIMKLVKREINIPYERLYCENSAVNAVAVYFLALADADGFKTEAQLNIPEQTGSVPAMDLCIIMGNLLENALGNAGRAKDENRYIRLSSSLKDASLYIEVIHSIDLAIDPPASSEGHELSAVKAICEKHHGNVEQEIKPNECKVTALVKIEAVEEPHPAKTAGDFEVIFSEYGLSKREKEVAYLVVKEGAGTKEIASRLYISHYTVNDHIASIYRKFKVTNRGEFMAVIMKKISKIVDG